MIDADVHGGLQRDERQKRTFTCQNVAKRVKNAMTLLNKPGGPEPKLRIRLNGRGVRNLGLHCPSPRRGEDQQLVLEQTLDKNRSTEGHVQGENRGGPLVSGWGKAGPLTDLYRSRRRARKVGLRTLIQTFESEPADGRFKKEMLNGQGEKGGGCGGGGGGVWGGG